MYLVMSVNRFGLTGSLCIVGILLLIIFLTMAFIIWRKYHAVLSSRNVCHHLYWTITNNMVYNGVCMTVIEEHLWLNISAVGFGIFTILYHLEELYDCANTVALHMNLLEPSLAGCIIICDIMFCYPVCFLCRRNIWNSCKHVFRLYVSLHL